MYIITAVDWLLTALLAPAVYTVVNFIDKYIVSKEVKDYRGMPIYGTIMGFIIGTIFWVITGFPVLSLRDAAIVLTTGAINIWAAALYFKAVTLEEASKIILLFQTGPLLTLLLAFLFLGEAITLTQFVGFLLILAAVMAVSIEKGKGKFKLSEGFILIFIVNLMFAVAAVLIKFAIEATSFSQILSFESWGLGLGGLVLYVAFPAIRNAFNQSLRAVRKLALGVMFFNEGLYVIGKSLTYFAFSIGSAALVSVVGSTQVFFGIFYGIIITLLVPKFIKEDISPTTL
jgi:bacterial/archaeal transporter family protein